MKSKSTIGALVLLGVTITWDGMSEGNTDIIRLGAVVSLVSGLLFFYYINKHEHFSRIIKKWMKSSKLRGAGRTKKTSLHTSTSKKHARRRYHRKNKQSSKRR